ncbi:MAG: FkbM family methyltransferase [Cytophagales bacterium]
MIRLFKYLSYLPLYTSFKLYILYKLSFKKCYRINFKGLKIKLRPKTTDFNLINQIYFDKQYDTKDLISKEPNLIIDLGANIGITSIYFSQKHPLSRIISLEPDSDNFELLEYNCKTLKNVTPLQRAIWNKNIDLVLNKDITPVGSFVNESKKGIEQSIVKGITMESLIKEFDIEFIDILKIDIEGAEYQLFLENTDWLKKVGCIMIETHDKKVHGTSHVLFKKMLEYNFKLSVKGETLRFYNITMKEN